MDRKISLNLGNMLLSLSEVTDFANPSIAQHQMRTAFIALKLARAADVGRETMEEIYAAALLHDVGASSVEEKIKIHNFDEADVSAHWTKIPGNDKLNRHHSV